MINNSVQAWFYRFGFLLICIVACAHGASGAETHQSVKVWGAQMAEVMDAPVPVAQAYQLIGPRFGHL